MIAADVDAAKAGDAAGMSKPRKYMPTSEVGAVQGRVPDAPQTPQTIGAQSGAQAGGLRSPSGDGDYGYDPIDQKGNLLRADPEVGGTIGFGANDDKATLE